MGVCGGLLMGRTGGGSFAGTDAGGLRCHLGARGWRGVAGSLFSFRPDERPDSLSSDSLNHD